jgi:hypothetical protein
MQLAAAMGIHELQRNSVQTIRGNRRTFRSNSGRGVRSVHPRLKGSEMRTRRVLVLAGFFVQLLFAFASVACCEAP